MLICAVMKKYNPTPKTAARITAITVFTVYKWYGYTSVDGRGSSYAYWTVGPNPFNQNTDYQYSQEGLEERGIATIFNDPNSGSMWGNVLYIALFPIQYVRINGIILPQNQKEIKPLAENFSDFTKISQIHSKNTVFSTTRKSVIFRIRRAGRKIPDLCRCWNPKMRRGCRQNSRFIMFHVKHLRMLFG